MTPAERIGGTMGGPDSSSIRAALAARGFESASCGFATTIASYRGHPTCRQPYVRA
jgi:hypothetical protein